MQKIGGHHYSNIATSGNSNQYNSHSSIDLFELNNKLRSAQDPIDIFLEIDKELLRLTPKKYYTLFTNKPYIDSTIYSLLADFLLEQIINISFDQLKQINVSLWEKIIPYLDIKHSGIELLEHFFIEEAQNHSNPIIINKYVELVLIPEIFEKIAGYDDTELEDCDLTNIEKITKYWGYLIENNSQNSDHVKKSFSKLLHIAQISLDIAQHKKTNQSNAIVDLLCELTDSTVLSIETGNKYSILTALMNFILDNINHPSLSKMDQKNILYSFLSTEAIIACFKDLDTTHKNYNIFAEIFNKLKTEKRVFNGVEQIAVHALAIPIAKMPLLATQNAIDHRIYKDHKILFNGMYSDGLFYKVGVPYTGFNKHSFYINGVAHSGLIDGILYEEGIPFSGISKENQHYKYGKSISGFSGGTLFIDGYEYTGVNDCFENSDNKYYFQGKLATGKYNELQYIKGTLAEEIFDGILYSNGITFSGISKENQHYKYGKPISGFKDDTLFKDGHEFTGLDNDKYYFQGKLATGKYNELQYIKGTLAEGIVDGILYITGKPFSGISKENQHYKYGKPAAGVYEGNVFGEDGKILHDIYITKKTLSQQYPLLYKQISSYKGEFWFGSEDNVLFHNGITAMITSGGDDSKYHKIIDHNLRAIISLEQVGYEHIVYKNILFNFVGQRITGKYIESDYGKTYFLNGNGVLLNGVYEIDNIKTVQYKNNLIAINQELIFNNKIHTKFIEGKLFSGISLIDNLFYQDGKLYSGWCKDTNKHYENGELYSGFLEWRYLKNGSLYTGKYKSLNFIEGKYSSLYIIENSKCIYDGKNFDGLYRGKLYINGTLAEGPHENAIGAVRFYKKGLPSVGIYNELQYGETGYLLEDEEYQGYLYKNGKKYLNTTIKYSNSEIILYKDGIRFNGNFIEGAKIENGIFPQLTPVSNIENITININSKDVAQYGEKKFSNFWGMKFKALHGFINDKEGEKLLYNDGKLYTGNYENYIYYEGLPLTGYYNNKLYDKGKLFTGIAENKGYMNGEVIVNGMLAGHLIKNGALYTGMIDDIAFKNGKLVSHELLMNKYYVYGVPRNGIEGMKLYKNGQLSEGIYQQYLFDKNGSKINGEFKGTFMQHGSIMHNTTDSKDRYIIDGKIADGDFDAEGTFIKGTKVLCTINKEGLLYIKDKDTLYDGLYYGIPVAGGIIKYQLLLSPFNDKRNKKQILLNNKAETITYTSFAGQWSTFQAFLICQSIISNKTLVSQAIYDVIQSLLFSNGGSNTTRYCSMIANLIYNRKEDQNLTHDFYSNRTGFISLASLSPFLKTTEGDTAILITKSALADQKGGEVNRRFFIPIMICLEKSIIVEGDEIVSYKSYSVTKGCELLSLDPMLFKILVLYYIYHYDNDHQLNPYYTLTCNISQDINYNITSIEFQVMENTNHVQPENKEGYSDLSYDPLPKEIRKYCLENYGHYGAVNIAELIKKRLAKYQLGKHFDRSNEMKQLILKSFTSKTFNWKIFNQQLNKLDKSLALYYAITLLHLCRASSGASSQETDFLQKITNEDLSKELDIVKQLFGEVMFLEGCIGNFLNSIRLNTNLTVYDYCRLDNLPLIHEIKFKVDYIA